MKEDNHTSGVKSLDKLVGIMECFSLEQPKWSLTDLSAHLGIPKSSLHRYLTGLEYHGLLRRGADDGLWRLGYRLFTWGRLVPEITSLRHIARPIMRKLVAATGETAILTIYDSQEVVCIEKVESDRAVRMNVLVGTRRHAHAGASSKVLMAFLPEEETRAIIRDRGLPKLSTSTITNPEELGKELVRIRERGYAMSHEETDQGAWGVAVPVRDSDGVVIAGIGVAGPSSRHTEELAQRYVDLCREAARRITAVLSGRTVDEGLEVN